MIVSGKLGLGHDPSNYVAYVGSWIKALKEDPLVFWEPDLHPTARWGKRNASQICVELRHMYVATASRRVHAHR